jgi:hypothetical protein
MERSGFVLIITYPKTYESGSGTLKSAILCSHPRGNTFRALFARTQPYTLNQVRATQIHKRANAGADFKGIASRDEYLLGRYDI